MGGNACTHLAVTTSKSSYYKGTDSLPRSTFQNIFFTIDEKHNTRYKCEKCGTYFPGLTKHTVENTEYRCPFCGSHSLVKLLSNLEQQLIDYTNHDTFTINHLANMFNTSYANMYQIVKKLNINYKKSKRGRPPKK